MPNPRTNPRPYRVRIFAPDGEILARDTFVVVLDLTPGHGSARARAELDSLLKNLAAQDNPVADAAGYHLTVTDMATGETFRWLAR